MKLNVGNTSHDEAATCNAAAVGRVASCKHVGLPLPLDAERLRDCAAPESTAVSSHLGCVLQVEAQLDCDWELEADGASSRLLTSWLAHLRAAHSKTGLMEWEGA